MIGIMRGHGRGHVADDGLDNRKRDPGKPRIVAERVAAGKVVISVKKIDCWKNLVWEFRKRDTSEAQQVFADYFNPTTETGPFAEMIEAVAEKIREGVAVWMNETAFDALKESFIKAMDLELDKFLRIESDHMSLNELDNDAIESMIEKCQDLNNRMKML